MSERGCWCQCGGPQVVGDRWTCDCCLRAARAVKDAMCDRMVDDDGFRDIPDEWLRRIIAEAQDPEIVAPIEPRRVTEARPGGGTVAGHPAQDRRHLREEARVSGADVPPGGAAEADATLARSIGNNPAKAAEPEPLLPCPFCGGSARHATQYVECSACLAAGPVGVSDLDSHNARLWNRRIIAEAEEGGDADAGEHRGLPPAHGDEARLIALKGVAGLLGKATADQIGRFEDGLRGTQDGEARVSEADGAPVAQPKLSAETAGDRTAKPAKAAEPEPFDHMSGCPKQWAGDADPPCICAGIRAALAEAKREGRREAFEEAARIVMEHPSYTPREVAEMIRSRIIKDWRPGE